MYRSRAGVLHPPRQSYVCTGRPPARVWTEAPSCVILSGHPPPRQLRPSHPCPLPMCYLTHSLIRVAARLLYRSTKVEVIRMWTPPSPGRGAGAGGGGGGGAGGFGGGGGLGGGTGSEGQLLRVRWRATCTAWLPWAQEEWLEVVATYRWARAGGHIALVVRLGWGKPMGVDGRTMHALQGGGTLR